MGIDNEILSSRSISEAPPTLDTSTTSTLSTPALRRCNSHASQRHGTIHQMDSISESGIVNDPSVTMVEDGDIFMEDSVVEGSSSISSSSGSRSYGQNRLTHSTIDIIVQASYLINLSSEGWMEHQDYGGWQEDGPTEAIHIIDCMPDICPRPKRCHGWGRRVI